MSIETYFKQLDLPQLKRAEEILNSMIKKITEGPRIGYWSIWTTEYPTEYFLADEYEQACERVAELMRLNGLNEKLTNYSKRIEFTYEADYSSELPEELKSKLSA